MTRQQASPLSAYRREPHSVSGQAVMSHVHFPIEPMTVRIPVAMRITGIGRSKLYALIKSGDIETVKIGSLTLVKMSSLRRLVRVPSDDRP